MHVGEVVGVKRSVVVVGLNGKQSIFPWYEKEKRRRRE